MQAQNRSIFDLSHERKLSCEMGKLIPIMCEEVLPGDTFRGKTDLVVRLQAMVAPIMHRVDVFTHFFYVPTRLLQTNWEAFITGGPTGTDTTAIPTVTSGAQGQAIGTLWDYFGLPCNTSDPNITVANKSVLAYPFRAYALIYNEWYRSQDLQPKVALSLGDGADTTTSMALLSRNWEKDYFTSALPFAQRGTGVSLPLGTAAPVIGIGKLDNDWASATNNLYESNGARRSYTVGSRLISDASTGLQFFVEKQEIGGVPYPNIRADLSSATAATINDLRQAFQLQTWMEKNARGGSRLVEVILQHFGVRSSDQRLQRPEFIGGGRSPIIVSEVLQTAPPTSEGDTALGTMAGHAYSALTSHRFEKSFEEHGYIIGILSIMPRTAYQQGIPRMWLRSSKLDFYWPSFAHLGEQSVQNQEIFATASNPTGVFGYQPRHEEYRQRESSVHGDFRESLNFWHMGRIFDTEPSLNSAFITASPTKRICAVETGNNCLVQLVNTVQAIRPIPKMGIPGRIDH